ncbi:MAG TPA: TetR/AcrR family transcriptional regulator [Acidimicrobiales bacterium]|jgi:AcrR family transcriptional regulator|nr:TetR/AcrR family transcriptional regulator [Acidimicrobiales bacterium]
MTVTSPRASTRQTPARDRLIASANELFYAEGIHTVGVDRIIEHAGVSRASFYNNFESKEQLIHVYLLGRHEQTTSRLDEVMAQHRDVRQKILAVFDMQAAVFRQPDFNGCAFMAACAEAPTGGTIEADATEFRRWIRTMFTDLATQAGAVDPDLLGRQLHLLYDGAGLTARMDSDADIAIATRAAAEVLLDGATAR